MSRQKKAAHAVGSSDVSGKDKPLDGDICQNKFSQNDIKSQYLLDYNSPNCNKSTKIPQYSAALTLVDQAKAGMLAAELAGDDDAWVEHFTAYIDAWPLAFAAEMERSI